MCACVRVSKNTNKINQTGAAVTMPNKVSIMPHLDHVTPECLAVGACNTLYLRPDPSCPEQFPSRRIYCGTNTDVIGVRDSFYRNLPTPTASPAEASAAADALFHKKPGMVIGGGGAARSAIYALRTWMQATDIYLVNRDAGEVADVMAHCEAKGYGDRLIHVSTPEQARALEVPGAIVACVPDFPPKTEDEKRARAVVEVFLQEKEGKGAMLEMCYNPTPYTALGALAEKAGWRVILGTEAMVWQGLEQDRYWLGLEVDELPVQKVRDVIAAKLATISRL